MPIKLHLPTNDRSWVMSQLAHVFFSCLFSVFLIIGMCTLLLGCNANHEGQCLPYDIVTGEVYGQKFSSKTCRECIVYIKSGCVKYRSYECYSAYVRVNYGNNKTCLYATAKDKKSQNASIISVNSHPIGDEITMFDFFWMFESVRRDGYMDYRGIFSLLVWRCLSCLDLPRTLALCGVQTVHNSFNSPIYRVTVVQGLVPVRGSLSSR